MQTQWTPTASQNTVAASRQPEPCCANCAAANMGNVGFTMPAFDQTTLLYFAAAGLAAVVIYSMMTKRGPNKSIARAKADYAQKFAAETGRFPRF